MNSPGALLQRRPLPNTGSGKNQSNCNARTRVKKKHSENGSKENVEQYWYSSSDTVSWSYPSFDYSDHNYQYDLYCFRPRGPNPFPRRSPRRLPKLNRNRRKQSPTENVSSEMLSHLKLDLHIQLSELSSGGRTTLTELPHNVSSEM